LRFGERVQRKISEPKKRCISPHGLQVMSNMPPGFLSPGMSKLALISLPVLGHLK
jgi:hypothetical protein